MNINARIVEAVVTLPILGTVSRNDKGEVVKSAERYRIHLYAVEPDWTEKHPLQSWKIAGVLNGGGYTSRPMRRSVRVLLPEGQVLIALRVDVDGFPLSRESLPVEIEVDELAVDNQPIVVIKDAAGVERMVAGRFRDSTAVPGPQLVDCVKSIIKKEMQPGGLLYGR